MQEDAVVVGIDVAKARLDVVVRGAPVALRAVDNDSAGHAGLVAALIAAGLNPDVVPYLIAAHESVEIGHRRALEYLGLRPLLNLDLRLGEGTGAALAFHLVEAAARLLDEMATFGEAGVSDKPS